MRKALVNRTIVLMLVIFLLGPFSAAAAKELELKIGVSVCMSGAAAATGLGLMRGLELAAEEINAAGGVKVQKDSYQIKLIMYDNKYDTKEGVAVANKLIYRDGVKYIVTMGAGLVVATNNLVVENKILQLAYCYGGKKTTNPGAPYTFKILMEPINSYTIFLPWIAQKYNLKTIALTSNDDETGLVQAEDAEFVAKKIGLEITDKVLAPRGTADLTPMLTKLIAKKPQAIDFGSWGGSDGPLACKQAKELGYQGVFIFIYTQSIPTWLKIAPDRMDGVLFGGVFGSAPTPKATRVYERYKEKYKQEFDYLVWRNYDALLVLKKAIETAGTLDTTAVRDTMSKVSVDGIFGPTRVGGKSYYGIDAQYLYPIALSKYDGKEKKFVELYRGSLAKDY